MASDGKKDGGKGWMNSPGKGGGGQVGAFDTDDDNVASNAANADKHFGDGDGGDIIEIPDMDEDQGIDADERVVHAPRNVNRRVPTLVELENDVKVAIPTGEGGLDISVLSNRLVPASLVYEDDSCWTFESLLRDVYNELSEESGGFNADEVFNVNAAEGAQA